MDVSFSYFCQEILSNPVMLITVLLTLGVIFVNGWTDAPNAIATCIGTRSMQVRHAIWMSAAFNFLGVLVMTRINSSVASTISNMVDFGGETHQALVALCAALFSIVVYSVVASLFGIPTSESHSLIAGLSGAAIAVQGGIGGINFHEWVKVLYGLVLSLALGFFAGWVICKVVALICADMDRRKTGSFFRGGQIFGAAFMSFMHGAQDGQKFIGVLFLGIAFCNGQSSVNGMSIPVWLMLLCRDHQIRGNGYGKTGKIPGIFCGPGRSFLSPSGQRVRYPGFHDTYQDQRHHGCGSRKAAVCDQLWRGKRYDADLDLYISGLRSDQFCNGKNIYDVFLR